MSRIQCQLWFLFGLQLFYCWNKTQSLNLILFQELLTVFGGLFGKSKESNRLRKTKTGLPRSSQHRNSCTGIHKSVNNPTHSMISFGSRKGSWLAGSGGPGFRKPNRHDHVHSVSTCRSLAGAAHCIDKQKIVKPFSELRSTLTVPDTSLSEKICSSYSSPQCANLPTFIAHQISMATLLMDLPSEARAHRKFVCNTATFPKSPPK